MAELDVPSHAMFKVILTGYGFWNLDYFRYLIPSFCVSQGLKSICTCACPPVCVCLLSTTTSDQLSGYRNHFTDVVSTLERGGIQKHPLFVSVWFSKSPKL